MQQQIILAASVNSVFKFIKTEAIFSRYLLDCQTNRHVLMISFVVKTKYSRIRNFYLNRNILLYKLVMLFCLLLKIYITTEPIEFSIFDQLCICPKWFYAIFYKIKNKIYKSFYTHYCNPNIPGFDVLAKERCTLTSA